MRTKKICLVNDKEEFFKIVLGKKFDHVSCLYQLKNKIWGIIYWNKKKSCGYWISSSNLTKYKEELQEVKNELISSKIDINIRDVHDENLIQGYKFDNDNSDIETDDTHDNQENIKKSVIFSVEILEKILMLVDKETPSRDWKIKINNSRQEELGKNYDQIEKVKEEIKKNFLWNFER